MKLLRQLSLQSKMIIFIVALVLFQIGTMSYVSTNLVDTILEDQMGKRVLSVSQTIASMPEVARLLKQRDPDGQLQVLAESVRLKTGAQFVVIGDSQAHQLWREMRVLANRGRSITERLGADVQSIIACRSREIDFSGELDVMDKRLQGLSVVEHKYLFAAQQSLRECGTCRSSALHYCGLASKQLEQEMAVLLPPLKAAGKN